MQPKQYLHINLFLILTLPFFFSGCTFRSAVIQGAKPAVYGIELSFFNEDDVAFAGEALPGIIKITEGMFNYHPKSHYLAGKLCFLYAAYTFGYLDNSPYSDFDADADNSILRMISFYEKSYSYGKKGLNIKYKNFSEKIKTKESRTKILQKLKKNDVEILFWMTFSRAMMLFNDTANPSLLFELEVIKHCADRIAELDPGFLNGSVYALFTAFYGGRTDSLGGNRRECDAMYSRGQSYAEGKSLILDYVYLRYVLTQQNDSAPFEELYKKIMKFDPDSVENFKLFNHLIRQKTKFLHSKMDWLF